MNRCKFGGDTHVLKPIRESDMNLTHNIVPMLKRESYKRAEEHASGKNGIYIDPISWTHANTYHLSSTY